MLYTWWRTRKVFEKFSFCSLAQLSRQIILKTRSAKELDTFFTIRKKIGKTWFRVCLTVGLFFRAQNWPFYGHLISFFKIHFFPELKTIISGFMECCQGLDICCHLKEFGQTNYVKGKSFVPWEFSKLVC